MKTFLFKLNNKPKRHVLYLMVHTKSIVVIIRHTGQKKRLPPHFLYEFTDTTTTLFRIVKDPRSPMSTRVLICEDP